MLLLAPIQTLSSASATIQIPPFDRYGLVLNIGGKTSGYTGQDLTSSQLCPCLFSPDGKYCTYGKGAIEEYKEKDINVNYSSVMVINYTTTAVGSVRASPGGNGTFITWISIIYNGTTLSNTIINRTSVADPPDATENRTVVFLSQEAWSGSIDVTLPQPGTYTLRWSLYLNATSSTETGGALLDFYKPYGFNLNAQISFLDSPFISTSSFVPMGAPSVATYSSENVTTISQSYASNLGFPTKVFLWVSVENPSGSTVAISLGEGTVNPGETFTIAAALLDLTPGMYIAHVFITAPVLVASPTTVSSEFRAS